MAKDGLAWTLPPFGIFLGLIIGTARINCFSPSVALIGVGRFRILGSFRRRVPIRFLISQCQIITFLILKYDIIENSRIQLRGIVLPVQMGGLRGGGAKGMLAPPLKLLGGGAPLPPPLFLRLWPCPKQLITRLIICSVFDLSGTAALFYCLLLCRSPQRAHGIKMTSYLRSMRRKYIASTSI